MIEAFNGRFRSECLNENWFLSLEDAREKVEAWKEEYNKCRQHSALGSIPPVEIAELAEANKVEKVALDLHLRWGTPQ